MANYHDPFFSNEPIQRVHHPCQNELTFVLNAPFYHLKAKKKVFQEALSCPLPECLLTLLIWFK